MHLHTSDMHLLGNYGFGHHFVEGAADYFTKIVCEKNAIPFVAAYDAQYKGVMALARVIGDEELAMLTFHGQRDGTKQILESKGEGTYDAYRKKWKTDAYPAAARMLEGVKEANDARLEREAAAEHGAERDEQARRDDAKVKMRDGWPREGTKPVKVTRVISKNIVGGKTWLMVPAGGMSGIREGWTVRVRTGDGKTLELPVVRVLDHTSDFEIDPELADSVQPLEIRPRQ